MPRRSLIALYVSLAVAALPSGASGQSFVLDVPLRSQHATVSQRIGLTDVTIQYSRPLVNGREIWNGLVPYGQVWRVGANTNTTISFSDPVTIDGHTLDRGTYGLHAIPNADSWTIIFSRNSTSWGSFTYDSTEDALRIQVKPVPAAPHPALTFEFVQLQPNAAVVEMDWDRLAVSFPVAVDVHTLMQASLRRQLRTLERYTWMSWNDAASYLLGQKLALDTALVYTAESVALEDRFENELTRSRVLTALGRDADATAARQKAVALGTPADRHQVARDLLRTGHRDEAFALFRENAAKHGDQWIAHEGLARMLSAQGLFPDAQREISLALGMAPSGARPELAALQKQLEARQDINR